MRSLILIGTFLGLSISIIGQVRGRPEATPLTPTDQAIRRANDISRRSNELRNVENFPVKNEENKIVFQEQIQPLYRVPSDEEMSALAPKKEFSAKYSAFLDGKDTGLVKLAADNGCADNVKVVNASADCAAFTMPGGGSAYSFRELMHRLIRLADLNFRKNSLQALGTLTHGVMVNLGDVDIESLTLEADGVGYITKFSPAKDMNGAAEVAGKLIKGIKDKEYIYGSVLAAKPDSTYVLRSIAYRGEALRSVGGLVYNELDFDKRRDVIVAFRIVEMIPDKSITILWKELRDKKSPKIEIKK